MALAASRSGLAFSKAIRRGHHGAENQTVAVVAQGVTRLAQLTGGFALAVQPCSAIGFGAAHGPQSDQSVRFSPPQLKRARRPGGIAAACQAS